MILIVDDSDSFRELLTLELGVGRVRAAGTIVEGLRRAVERQPRVILLDHWFDVGGSEGGIDAIPAFQRLAPDAEIIVLTADIDPHDKMRAIDAGASAYVEKGDSSALWGVLAMLAGMAPPSGRAGASLVPSLMRLH